MIGGALNAAGQAIGGALAALQPDAEVVDARTQKKAARRANRLEGRANVKRKKARRALKRENRERYETLMDDARDLDEQARKNWLRAGLDPLDLSPR